MRVSSRDSLACSTPHGSGDSQRSWGSWQHPSVSLTGGLFRHHLGVNLRTGSSESLTWAMVCGPCRRPFSSAAVSTRTSALTAKASKNLYRLPTGLPLCAASRNTKHCPRQTHWLASDNVSCCVKTRAARRQQCKYPVGAARHPDCCRYCSSYPTRPDGQRRRRKTGPSSLRSRYRCQNHVRSMCPR
jgi:hypothetical protein